MTTIEEMNAPYNQEDPKEQEVEVTVSITMSKTMKVKVKDYQYIEDYDEDYNKDCGYLSFKDCDLEEAVLEQHTMPQNSKEFKDWNIDDFEVNID